MIPLLSVENLQTGYGPNTVLRDIELKIYEKEIVTLIGANGAGKTTLLMSLFGIPQIQKGHIEYRLSNNQKIALQHTRPHEIAGLGIAIAPEGRRIFSKMSVHENLLMGATAAHQTKTSEIKDQLELIYSLFPILNQRQQQRAGTLSGGEQQMLAIGRALMSKPKLLLLDEPSLGLAPKIAEEIFKLLKKINDEGITILLVEQKARQALKLAHRGYVLVNGRITLTGTGNELLNNPEVQKAYLGESSYSLEK